MTRSHHWQ